MSYTRRVTATKMPDTVITFQSENHVWIGKITFQSDGHRKPYEGRSKQEGVGVTHKKRDHPVFLMG
jgi:hypothetical protein